MFYLFFFFLSVPLFADGIGLGADVSGVRSSLEGLARRG